MKEGRGASIRERSHDFRVAFRLHELDTESEPDIRLDWDQTSDSSRRDMRVKYFADGVSYEIEAPEGTAVEYRSHVRNRSGEFLDDLLVLPWRGLRLGLEGAVIQQAATEGVLGLRLARVATHDHTSASSREP